MSQFENNKKIIEQFGLLRKQIQYDLDFGAGGKEQRKNMYRLAAIIKVMDILKKYDKEIKSADQLKNIKGIGIGSLERIDEILKKGKLSEIKIPKDIDKYLQMIDELEQVHGIGRKFAYELFKNHNITSIEDLRKAYDTGKIDLPDVVAKGLFYVDKIKGNIPREDIDELRETLIKTTLEIDPKLFGIVCGSYRRQKPTSNDIDFLIFHTNMVTMEQIEKSKINYLEIFIKKLKGKKIIVDSLTSEYASTKYMGIATVNKVLRRIDIRMLPYSGYYPAILYFTGSKDTNRKMRLAALSMGYTLNEYGLFDENKKIIPVSSEKEIFEILGLEYLSPEKR